MWTLTRASEFAACRDAWQKVAARATASVMVHADFVQTVLDAFGSGAETVAIHEGSDGPDAAAVVHQSRPGVWTTFHPTEVGIGLWVQPREMQFASLLSGLMRQLPGLPIMLAVLQQDPLLLTRPKNRGPLRTVDSFRTAWVAVDGDFDRYWAARGKNLRNNMKRARTELRKAGIFATLDIVTARADVKLALEDYSRLEATGWKGISGTAVRMNNPQGRFYLALLERACEQGLGKIYRYRFDGQTVAMDLCLTDGANLVILKTAYDEAHARFSPSSMMREEQCQHIFAEGEIRRIEFYGPLMEWHTRWTHETRVLYHINYYGLPWLPWVHAVARTLRGNIWKRYHTEARADV